MIFLIIAVCLLIVCSIVAVVNYRITHDSLWNKCESITSKVRHASEANQKTNKEYVEVFKRVQETVERCNRLNPGSDEYIAAIASLDQDISSLKTIQRKLSSKLEHFEQLKEEILEFKKELKRGVYKNG